MNLFEKELPQEKKCTKCKKVKPLTEFSFRNKTERLYHSRCKECISVIEVKRKTTEEGYLGDMYYGILKRCKSIQDDIDRRNNKPKKYTDAEKKAHSVHVTKEQFFELWEKHKEKYGMKDAFLMEPIVIERGKGHGKGVSIKNRKNLSVDRLDVEQGYTKDNIVFTSHFVNSAKNGCTIQMAMRILELFVERFPDDRKGIFIQILAYKLNNFFNKRYAKEMLDWKEANFDPKKMPLKLQKRQGKNIIEILNEVE